MNSISKIEFSKVVKKCYIDKEVYASEMIKNYMKEQALFYLVTKQGTLSVLGMGNFYKENVEIDDYVINTNTITKEIYIPVYYEMDNQEYTCDLYTCSYVGETSECRLITNRLVPGMYNTSKGIYGRESIEVDSGVTTLLLE